MSASEKLALLIVDDSPEDRFTYRRLLDRGGEGTFAVTETDRGDEALERCGGDPPDCILLDYQLPDMTGIEVLESLAEMDRQIPVVMLTGQGSEQVAVAAMKLGVQDYLVKGALTPETLTAAVHSAIEKVRLRRQVQAQRQALIESNRELERFACMVAHDLQNPLSSMTMFLSVLRKMESDPKAREYADRALESSARMRRLIRDLLEFSKMDGRLGARTDVDCAAVVKEARHNLDALITESGATIDVGELPTVYGDAAQLLQVFQNLIENGIRYRSADPPVITVSCQRHGAGWLFGVSDNGLGIDEEMHEKIFEPFTRLPGNPDVPGNGLGLAICKKAIEYHGGRIWIESRAGEGTTFLFTLPGEAGSEGE